MQLDAIRRNEAGLCYAHVCRQRRSYSQRTAEAQHRQKHGSVSHGVMLIRPNELKFSRA